MSAAVDAQSMVVDEFILVWRNTLRGFAKITLPSGMSLSDMAVHQSGGGAWASPPSKPVLDRDGVAQREPGEKIRYLSIVSCAKRETRDRFSAAVIDELRAAHPESLS